MRRCGVGRVRRRHRVWKAAAVAAVPLLALIVVLLPAPARLLHGHELGRGAHLHRRHARRRADVRAGPSDPRRHRAHTAAARLAHDHSSGAADGAAPGPARRLQRRRRRRHAHDRQHARAARRPVEPDQRRRLHDPALGLSSGRTPGEPVRDRGRPRQLGRHPAAGCSQPLAADRRRASTRRADRRLVSAAGGLAAQLRLAHRRDPGPCISVPPAALSGRGCTC